MPIPLAQQPFNIRYSLQRHVSVNFDVPNAAYSVNYNDVFFNTDVRDEESSPLGLWVKMRFLRNLAGRKDFGLVQFDCFSRFGETEDPLGEELAAMVNDLIGAMTVKHIDIFDYTVTPSTPVLQTDNCIIPWNSNGHFAPEDHAVAEWEGGDALREIVTWRFQTVADSPIIESFAEGV